MAVNRICYTGHFFKEQSLLTGTSMHHKKVDNLKPFDTMIRVVLTTP